MDITDIEYSIDGGPAQSSGKTDFPITIPVSGTQTRSVRVRNRSNNIVSPWSNAMDGTPETFDVGAPIITGAVPGNANAEIYWTYIPGKGIIHSYTDLGESVLLEVGLVDDGNLPITGWEYLVTPSNGQWQSTTATNNQIVVTGLEPHSDYLVKVRATNDMGTGLPSEDFEVTTGSGQTTIIGGDLVYDISVGALNYRVHEYHTSGQVNVQNGGAFEWLMVAGGGGGGFARGGGGGGGGVLERSGNLNSGIYPVVVGEGGRGNTDPDENAEKGGDTTFAGETAVGGGYGGTEHGNGGDGGSGGGSGQSSGLPGSGILGQGSDGEGGTNYYGKRGGGARNTNSTSFDVRGRMSDITGQDVEYGRGGLSNSANGGAKPDNTGFGGDGSDGWAANGGEKGGSGIFIIRYQIN